MLLGASASICHPNVHCKVFSFQHPGSFFLHQTLMPFLGVLCSNKVQPQSATSGFFFAFQKSMPGCFTSPATIANFCQTGKVLFWWLFCWQLLLLVALFFRLLSITTNRRYFLAFFTIKPVGFHRCWCPGGFFVFFFCNMVTRQGLSLPHWCAASRFFSMSTLCCIFCKIATPCFFLLFFPFSYVDACFMFSFIFLYQESIPGTSFFTGMSMSWHPLPQRYLQVCGDFCDFFYFCWEGIVFVDFLGGGKVDSFQAAVNCCQIPGGVFGIFNNQPVGLLCFQCWHPFFPNVDGSLLYFNSKCFFFAFLSNFQCQHIFSMFLLFLPDVNCTVVFLQSTTWTPDGVNAICMVMA